MHNVYVFVAGLVSGAVVAGIYGKRVVAKVKEELAVAEAKVASFELKLKNKL